MSDTINPRVLEALSTIAGGETVARESLSLNPTGRLPHHGRLVEIGEHTDTGISAMIQFSIRKLMLAIAVVAVFIGGYIEWDEDATTVTLCLDRTSNVLPT